MYDVLYVNKDYILLFFYYYYCYYYFYYYYYYYYNYYYYDYYYYYYPRLYELALFMSSDKDAGSVEFVTRDLFIYSEIAGCSFITYTIVFTKLIIVVSRFRELWALAVVFSSSASRLKNNFYVLRADMYLHCFVG